jgi:hypothetical protein
MRVSTAILLAIASVLVPPLTAVAATDEASPPDVSISSSDESTGGAGTRAFQTPDPTETRSAARNVGIVLLIAAVGIAALFAGWYCLYTPKAWRTPYRPTPILPREKRAETWDEGFDKKDRYDLEGDLGDYYKELDQ